MKKKKGFTLVELVTVLVILAIVALIATPLVLTLIKNTEISANKKSIDAYGKAVEMAAMSHMMKKGDYPKDLYSLKTKYTGKEVKCNVMYLNTDGSLFLSKCTVDGVEVKAEKEFDGYYHYGKVEEVKEAPAVSTILAKANDASINTYEVGSAASHELYTFNQKKTAQTDALTDYRYIGNDPYNYVTFNNELWRIIGVFEIDNIVGQRVKKIKLIRNDFIGNQEYIWNGIYREEYDDYEDGPNDWTKAYLNKYLNEEYYKTLSSGAKDLIDSTKYYLGGIYGIDDMSAEYLYKMERSKQVNSKNTEYSWTGNIGLMYPSDYIYTYANGVDNVCFKYSRSCGEWYWDEETETDIESNAASGWLFVPEDDEDSYRQWTISQDLESDADVWRIGSSGYLDTSSTTSERYVRPTVYLNSSAIISGGDGSLANPYKLSAS